jgi:hypothetical protein
MVALLLAFAIDRCKFRHLIALQIGQGKQTTGASINGRIYAEAARENVGGREAIRFSISS